MSGTIVFTIGELMQQSGISIRTLRYYDSIDLLKPSDYTEGGHRLYNGEDLATLQRIKSLQSLGFTLKEIKKMLQKHTAKGSELLEALNDQKQLFAAKKREITNVLADLDHLIEGIKYEETVDIPIFCVMLQKLMFEEDTKKWFEDHFSKDITDELVNINQLEEINLDKRWAHVLSQIKQLTIAGACPSSEEAQFVIKSLMELMNDTTKGNLALITEKLPANESLSFPNPFTKEEAVFLQKAMRIFQSDDSLFET